MTYTLPATLTLKNLKTIPAHETDLFNTGLGAVETGDALHPTAVLENCAPVLNTAEYEGTVQIPVYGNAGQYYLLKPEEKITVTVKTDAEALFYIQMAEDGVLEVSVTEG